jgi:hypothetical protein
VPTADITSTQLLIETNIKGSSFTADNYLFSPSELEPEPDPGIRIEPNSVVKGPEGAGAGAVSGAGDPSPGIGGRVGGVIAGAVTGCGAAAFADAATLGADIFGFVVSCGCVLIFFAAVFSFAHAFILSIIPLTPFPFFRAGAFVLIFFVFFFVIFALLVMIALPIVTALYRRHTGCSFRKLHPRSKMRFWCALRDGCKADGASLAALQ